MGGSPSKMKRPVHLSGDDEVMGSLLSIKRLFEQYRLPYDGAAETQESPSKTKRHFRSQKEQDEYSCPKTTPATTFSCSKNPLTRDYLTRQIRYHRPNDVPPLKDLTSIAWPVVQGLSLYVIHLEVPEDSFSPHDLRDLITTIRDLNTLIPHAPLTRFTWSSALKPEYRVKTQEIVLSQFPDSPEGSFLFENEANLVHEMMHGIYRKLKIAQDPRWKCLYWFSLADKSYEIVDDSNFLWGSSDIMGHPFEDPDELFASAGYAYRQSPDLLRDFILNENTPDALKLFGKLVWCYFRDEIFSGQVFTKNGEDPFAQESFGELWIQQLSSTPLSPIVPLIESSQNDDELVKGIAGQVLIQDFNLPLDEYGATALLSLVQNKSSDDLKALAPLKPQILEALNRKAHSSLEAVEEKVGIHLESSFSQENNLPDEIHNEKLLDALASLYNDSKTKDPNLAITALSLLTAFSKGNSQEGRRAHLLVQVASDPSISLRVRAQALIYLKNLQWKGYHEAIRDQMYRLAESRAWGIRMHALHNLYEVAWKSAPEQQKLLEIIESHLKDPEDEVARHAFTVSSIIAQQSDHPLATQAQACLDKALETQWENLKSSSPHKLKQALSWLSLAPRNTEAEIDIFFKAVTSALNHRSAEVREAARSALYQSDWGHRETEAQAQINKLAD